MTHEFRFTFEKKKKQIFFLCCYVITQRNVSLQWLKFPNSIELSLLINVRPWRAAGFGRFCRGEPRNFANWSPAEFGKISHGKLWALTMTDKSTGDNKFINANLWSTECTCINQHTKSPTSTSSRTAWRPSSSAALQLMDWWTSLASSGTLALSRSNTSHSNPRWHHKLYTQWSV